MLKKAGNLYIISITNSLRSMKEFLENSRNPNFVISWKKPDFILVGDFWNKLANSGRFYPN